MGYGWEFWWLAEVDVTFRWKATEILSHIPLRLKPRAFACSLALNPQKFDCELRSPLRMTGWLFVLL